MPNYAITAELISEAILASAHLRNISGREDAILRFANTVRLQTNALEFEKLLNIAKAIGLTGDEKNIIEFGNLFNQKSAS